MRTSSRSVFHHWSRNASVTDRIAVYGPVRTVVWQGSAGDRRHYADQYRKCAAALCVILAARSVFKTRSTTGSESNPTAKESETTPTRHAESHECNYPPKWSQNLVPVPPER